MKGWQKMIFDNIEFHGVDELTGAGDGSYILHRAPAALEEHLSEGGVNMNRRRDRNRAPLCHKRRQRADNADKREPRHAAHVHRLLRLGYRGLAAYQEVR